MKSQLTDALRSISSQEMSDFSDWIASPAHITSPKIRELWAFLKPFAPQFTNPACTREEAFCALYGAKKYSRLPINNLLSDLWYHYLDFLAYQKLRANPAQRQQWISETFQERNQLPMLAKQIDRWERLMQEVSTRSDGYHHQQTKLQAQKDRFFLRQSQRNTDPSLQLQNDHLDQAFFIQKYRLACAMLNRNKLLQTNYQFSLQTELETALRRAPHLQGIPAIEIYRRILTLLQNPDETPHYQQFKEYLLAYEKMFPDSERNELYGYALNHCIQRINYGHSAYYQEILELYQKLLPQGLLWQEGHLSIWMFRNIVTAGIRTESFAWTQSFIREYQIYLPPDSKENAVRYNLASYHYAVQDYQSALQQLHGVEFTDNFYQLGAKTIQLKSYFELGEGEAFYSLTEAFRKYLARHRKLSEYHRTSNQAFLRLTKRLFKLKQSPKASRQYEVKRKELAVLIEQTKPLANKDWLAHEWGRLA
ncbi:MAG: hypothetical protein AAGH79_10530 [Bacteroidota bacterium]